LNLIHARAIESFTPQQPNKSHAVEQNQARPTVGLIYVPVLMGFSLA
jgi:hypothetical protein